MNPMHACNLRFHVSLAMKVAHQSFGAITLTTMLGCMLESIGIFMITTITLLMTSSSYTILLRLVFV